MTPEDLIGKVKFSIKRDGLQIELTALLEVRAVGNIDRVYENNDGYVQHLKRELVETLIRHLYEDQRTELYEAIEELDYCNPTDFAAQCKARDRIFKAAKFQKPRRSKCCNARVKLGGKMGEGSTRWYQCQCCSAGCDIIPPVSG